MLAAELMIYTVQANDIMRQKDKTTHCRYEGYCTTAEACMHEECDQSDLVSEVGGYTLGVVREGCAYSWPPRWCH